VYHGRFHLLRISFCVGLSCLITSCTYLQNFYRQAGYSQIQKTNPSQLNLKHMIDRQTFLVYGLILDEANDYSGLSLMVVAYSNRYKANEVVDSTYVAHAGTHYGLNLPAGQHDLIVFADENKNNYFEQAEAVGRRRIQLSVAIHPDKVVNDIDIPLSEQEPTDWIVNTPVPEVARTQESLFYPKGTIRELNDPLFDLDIATLGMYEPAAFLELAPTMFYALEEDSYKIPVIFVHGIGGSAREFVSIVDRLDRQRYQPWFFYYPSGNDLNQLAEIFYDIFLSGRVNRRGEMPIVIVAHSMGGLVVREALNQYRGDKHENRVGLLITIASPLGGHPSAAAGEKRAPLVLPSWRDLNPESTFIKHLFRKSLPSGVSHHLMYTYLNPKKLAQGKGDDGVVPTSSQLRPGAERQSTQQFGFNNSHTGVLRDEDAIERIIQSISKVKSVNPESHLKILMAGGYDVDLDNHYSAKEKHYIRSMGKYLYALASGTLYTLGSPVLERFVEVARGKAKAKSDPETAWIKFVSDYPQYGG